MTIARKNAQLAQTISVSGNAVGDTLFVPASGLVNVSGSLTVNNIPVSVSGHSHVTTNITDFNSGVSGLLPVVSVSGSGYVNVVNNNKNFIVSVSGLQPSGNYSVVGHSHISTDITDFNSSVSGLIPVKNVVGGNNVSVTSSSGIYIVSVDSTTQSTERASSVVTTVFNKTGAVVPKMAAVYINGGQGDLPTIQLAIATGDLTSAATYGLTYETISDMSTGRVVVLGALSGVNTDQFNPTAPQGEVNGQILYLSPTISGGLTTIKPYAPDHIVSIGTIVRTHQNEGVIEVRVQNGFELEELHNVAVTGVTDGQFLQYNSSSRLWLPSSSGNFNTLQVSGILVPTGIGTSNYVTKWTGTHSISSGIIYDDGTNVGIGTNNPTTKLDVAGSANISGDVIVGGNVTINGTTTSINVDTIVVEDPIITLGLTSGNLVTDTNLDRGLALIRSSGVTAFMGWDTSENEFSLLSSGVPTNNSGNYSAGTYGNLRIGSLFATSSGLFSSTIDAPNLGTGEDNSVVVLTSDGKLRTDEIDSRVWGSSLVDGSGLANHIPYWLDNDTLTYDSGQLYWDSTNNRLGIGTLSPSTSLHVNGSGLFSSGLIINNQTPSTIASFDSNKNVISLSTSTYPSLTELSYVKGVSGSIQTQINNKANSTHSHVSSDITDFNSSVSGLLPLTGLVGSGYISVVNNNRNFIISATGLQPSGNYSIVGHSHVLNDITDAGSIASQNFDNVNITSGTINNFNVSNYSPINDSITVSKNKVKKYNYFINIETSGNIGIYNILAENNSGLLTESSGIITSEYYGSKNYAIPSGGMWQYCLNFNCFNTTDNLSASFNMRGCVKYMASGALFVGSQIKEAWKDSGMENTDLTISTIDNNLTVQTTGLTNKQLNWGGVLNIVEFIK